MDVGDDERAACPRCGHDDRVAAQSLEGVLARLVRQPVHCQEWVPDREGWVHPCGCDDDFHTG